MIPLNFIPNNAKKKPIGMNNIIFRTASQKYSVSLNEKIIS